ncbi:MAG TPA: cation transporter [Candidatus Avilachnospira avistercoris]|nr:cation transporter [Candidatus Avilachnospira avistercoris]
MTDFLIKRFIKEPADTENASVRSAYAMLSGFVGIAVNILLFLCKIVIGLLSGAVSVVADAFNNLSDVASSVITVIGMRLAGQPADKEHPFGHGRIEYLTALCTSVMVLCVGFLLLFNSVKKILNPEELSFSYISILILLVSILGKAFLSSFNRKLGTAIRSNALLAVSADARSDMLATGAAVLSLVLYYFTHINIDGIMGALVSGYVIKTGLEIARDTLLPIIGASATKDDFKELTEFIEGYDKVLGTHDLIVHNYGPGRNFATIHVEIPDDMSLEDAHILLDGIEHDVQEKFDILLVTHADPVDIHDERAARIRELLSDIIKREQTEGLNFHDVRIINASGGGLNVVFDLLIPWQFDEADTKAIKDKIKKSLKAADPSLRPVITVEHGY